MSNSTIFPALVSRPFLLRSNTDENNFKRWGRWNNKRWLLATNYYLPGCYYSKKTKNLLIQFEEILENIHLSNEKLVSTQQTRYIEAFIMLIYFTYMNELVIVNGPLESATKRSNEENKYWNYTLIEKKLLESSIGPKDDLKKIVYKSGWLWNNLAKNTSVIQVCQDHNEDGEYLFHRKTLTLYNTL
ncbi:hypothetical protein BD770DRAFT_431538 [Pilaira anomala]|nr:hypothetical protein BD770DRAFT_431538 [Pilaira anomala]